MLPFCPAVATSAIVCKYLPIIGDKMGLLIWLTPKPKMPKPKMGAFWFSFKEKETEAHGGELSPFVDVPSSWIFSLPDLMFSSKASWRLRMPFWRLQQPPSTLSTSTLTSLIESRSLPVKNRRLRIKTWQTPLKKRDLPWCGDVTSPIRSSGLGWPPNCPPSSYTPFPTSSQGGIFKAQIRSCHSPASPHS